jgi:hypothetical protein
MPIGFVGPALKGASLISRFGIPLLQSAGIYGGIAGLESAANTLSKRRSNQGPPGGDVTGRYIPGSQQYPFISGSPSPVNLPPADTFGAIESPAARRAYQGEKARAAQMTEQDPLFKKYQVADLTKAYNAAASPEEKERIGLQIWATTNPELAKRVRPGQVGYQTSAAMKGSQVFGKDIPGITETMYQQASQAAGLPSNVSFTPGPTPIPNAFGLGADAQQFGISAPGTMPPSMIGEQVFKPGFNIPSSEDLTQTQLALLKRAFEGRIK